jgi:hypothetical protein
MTTKGFVVGCFTMQCRFKVNKAGITPEYESLESMKCNGDIRKLKLSDKKQLNVVR